MKTLEAKIDTLERRIGWIMLMSAISVILGLAKLYIQTSAAAPSQNTNSLNIGPQSAATAGPQRDYLTTEEVATRENVSPRTVLTWIETGRIHPTPTRTGRAWTIAPHYRLQPQFTADSR
jgi:excisionase family DNA binding protein